MNIIVKSAAIMGVVLLPTQLLFAAPTSLPRQGTSDATPLGVGTAPPRKLVECPETIGTYPVMINPPLRWTAGAQATSPIFLDIHKVWVKAEGTRQMLTCQYMNANSSIGQLLTTHASGGDCMVVQERRNAFDCNASVQLQEK